MFENTPLNGVRVLDFTRYASGPSCTSILGDLGADVWKVERPGRGDETRGFNPTASRGNESAYFHSMNRNKRSFTLNYTSPEVYDLILELVKKVDIVVENNAPGSMRRYGLDYETLSKVNPKLIMLSISGFGQKDSPYVKNLAFDGVVQAISGIFTTNGYPDSPVKVGIAFADLMAGHYGVMGVLAALYERNISGKGQYIDVAMLDAAVATMEHHFFTYAFDGKPLPRFGNGHDSVVPTNTFDSKDGSNSIYVSCSSDVLAARIADLIGRPELKEDPRYKYNIDRVANRDMVDEAVNQFTSQYTKEELIKMFNEVGVPCCVVNDIPSTFHDPHMKERGTIVEMEHPLAGKVIGISSPLHMSRNQTRLDNIGPVLGSSNSYIFKEILNMDDTAIQKLKDKGLI